MEVDLRNIENKPTVVSIKSGWFVNSINNEFITDNYRSILHFYIVETLCDSLSYKGKSVKSLGWSKNVWKKDKLKKLLISIIAEKRKNDEFLFYAKKIFDIKTGVKLLGMEKGFHRGIQEKILVYKMPKYSQIESIFYHIRNSLAHGRFQIYKRNDSVVYVLESGFKKEDDLELRARIILKEETLIRWMEIIRNPNIYQ